MRIELASWQQWPSGCLLVWGLGFGVEGLGFRVWGLGLRVWGFLGFRVEGLGFGGLGRRMLDGLLVILAFGLPVVCV